MAYSVVHYTGDGVTASFAVPFPFLTRDHITVTVNGIAQVPSWVNDGLLQLSTAPANGTAIFIARDSSRTGPLVDFQDAQLLTEADLDTANRQALYVAQEAFDASGASETAAQVAADAAAVALAATNAANSATSAGASANNAANSATAAAVSAADAATSAASVSNVWHLNAANAVTPAQRATIDPNVTFDLAAATLSATFLLKPSAPPLNIPANKMLTAFRSEGTYKLNALSAVAPMSADITTDATSDSTGSAYAYKAKVTLGGSHTGYGIFSEVDGSAGTSLDPSNIFPLYLKAIGGSGFATGAHITLEAVGTYVGYGIEVKGSGTLPSIAYPIVVRPSLQVIGGAFYFQAKPGNSADFLLFNEDGESEMRFRVDKTGTVIAPLRDKGGQTFNVKAYGATGDGTTDDTTAIAAAITAAAGRDVFLPSGTYIVTTLTLATGTHLRGEDMSLTTIKRKVSAAGNTSVLNAVSADNVVLRNLTVDGNKAAQVNAANNISFVTSKNTVLDCVRSINAKGSGASYGAGIVISDGTNDTSGTASRITNCLVSTNDNDGMYVNKEWYISITGTEARGNGGSAVTVMNYVFPPVTGVQKHLNISGNQFHGNTSCGIRVVGGYTGGTAPAPIYGQTSPATMQCAISHNNCSGNGQYGIAYQGGWASIIGNQVSRNGTTTADGGILCNGWNCTVSNNTSYDNSYYGIDGGASLSCTFSANVIAYNGVTSGLGAIGLNIGGSVNSIVQGNSFDSNGTLAGSVHLNVAGIDADGAGVGFAQQGNHAVIIGNVFNVGANQTGVLINRKFGNAVLKDNIVNFNGGAGHFVVEVESPNAVKNTGNVVTAAGYVPSIASAATTVISDVGDTFVITGTTGITALQSKSQNVWAGKVHSVTITAGGSGYNPLSPPTVSFSGGGGAGAAGTVVVDNSGAVVGIIITNGGSGYTSAPGVTFSSGAATGTAVVGCNNNDGREVTLIFAGALTVTDAGTLVLAGNLNTAANTTLRLVGSGPNWVELSRSVN